MTIHDAILEFQSCRRGEDVARWLNARGYHGIPNDETECPLAHAFTNLTDTVCEVDGAFVTSPTFEAELPPALWNFIQQFDDGQYPELETANRPDRLNERIAELAEVNA